MTSNCPGSRRVRSPIAASLVGLASLAWCPLGGCGPNANENSVVVGSKAFPESWIVAEATRVAFERAHIATEHRRNLGGTEIAFGALRAGAIDLYPEYTGTIGRVLLHLAGSAPLSDLRLGLAPLGIGISEPLGFADGYALAVTREAQSRCPTLQLVSDLGNCRDLRFALSHEFLGRPDGWALLRSRYGLGASVVVRGVEHELAYVAAARGDVDVVDVYTTDPQISELGLRVLDDNLHALPTYEAVLLFRSDLLVRVRGANEVIGALEGAVNEDAIVQANAEVVLRRQPIETAAKELLGAAAAPRSTASAENGDVRNSRASGFATTLLQDVGRHVEIVSLSLVAAIFVGIPLGVGAARSRLLSTLSLGAAATLQTVPSLALLALLIPLFGVGRIPALFALFVYSLLPIIRNTSAAILAIPPSLKDAAKAIGLPARTRVLSIELPLASPVILAGVRTSAVINVATATLAALIGAGGLGGAILEGLALRSTPLILRGAIPVAVLALLVDAGFSLLGRVIVPRGLRVSVETHDHARG